jgi:hypothetical protein
MDTSRLTPVDMIAGAGGIVLLISLFLPWYGASVEVAGFSASESASGWEVLSLIDIILFLCAVVAIAVVAARAGGSLPADVPAGLVLFAAGALALLLVVFRIIDIPAGDVPDEIDLSRKIGIFIALLASAAITYAGWRANAERMGGPGRATADPSTPPPPAV